MDRYEIENYEEEGNDPKSNAHHFTERIRTRRRSDRIPARRGTRSKTAVSQHGPHRTISDGPRRRNRPRPQRRSRRHLPRRLRYRPNPSRLRNRGQKRLGLLVGRGWMAMFDHLEFWNPKVRAAESINPPAARSVLPYAYKRTELLMAGHSKQEVIATIKATIDKKELPALEQGTVFYRMSKDSYLGDYGGRQRPAHDVLRNSERRPQSTKNLRQESRSQTRGDYR
jgi:hypothetical protein